MQPVCSHHVGITVITTLGAEIIQSWAQVTVYVKFHMFSLCGFPLGSPVSSMRCQEVDWLRKGCVCVMLCDGLASDPGYIPTLSLVFPVSSRTTATLTRIKHLLKMKEQMKEPLNDPLNGPWNNPWRIFFPKSVTTGWEMCNITWT